MYVALLLNVYRVLETSLRTTIFSSSRNHWDVDFQILKELLALASPYPTHCQAFRARNRGRSAGKIAKAEFISTNLAQSVISKTLDCSTHPVWNLGCYALEKLYFALWKTWPANMSNQLCHLFLNEPHSLQWNVRLDEHYEICAFWEVSDVCDDDDECNKGSIGRMPRILGRSNSFQFLTFQPFWKFWKLQNNSNYFIELMKDARREWGAVAEWAKVWRLPLEGEEQQNCAVRKAASLVRNCLQ